MRFFSYKLTHDTGFAPNPFGRALTLATCKPQIRRCKQPGDWLAGFTSKYLNGDSSGSERLIYLMRIGEKLTIADYFRDERFRDKIPVMDLPGPMAKAGDNIYRPFVDTQGIEQLEQIRNPNHWDIDGPDEYHRERDLSGRYVLVADEFYYFGRKAISIPPFCRPEIPYGQSAHGKLTENIKAFELIRFIRSQYPSGIHGMPHEWPDDHSVSPGS